MGEREEEKGRQRARGWVALGGSSRNGSVLWTAPTMRSFPARPPSGADARRPERDSRSSGGGTPR